MVTSTRPDPNRNCRLAENDSEYQMWQNHGAPSSIVATIKRTPRNFGLLKYVIPEKK